MNSMKTCNVFVIIPDDIDSTVQVDYMHVDGRISTYEAIIPTKVLYDALESFIKVIQIYIDKTKSEKGETNG